MKIHNISQNTKLAVFGAVAGFCNGFFGSGGGMIAVPVMEKAAAVDSKKAHATAIAAVLPLTVVSIFRYMSFCSPEPATLFAVCAGGVAGSFIGAKLMGRMSANTIKRIFGIIIIITAVRMVIW